MNTTHFLEVHKPERRTLYGVLYTQQGSALQTVDALLHRAYDLGLMSHRQEFRIWSLLWRANVPPDAPYDALTTIADALNAFAAPGYEFSPSFLDGRTVWGWFPKQG
jgi:hypothetical protein